MKIYPMGAELFHADRRTDRHDEANSRFWQFCELAQKLSRACIENCRKDTFRCDVRHFYAQCTESVQELRLIQETRLLANFRPFCARKSSSSRGWTFFNCWKFWPSQRPPSSISLDPGRKLSNLWSSFGKCPVWCYPPICTWVFLVIFWSGVSN